MEFEVVLPRLVTLFDQGRLVPFVGLGLSLPTCSTWRQNINKLGAAAMAMGLGEFPDMANVDRDDLPRWAHRIVALLKRAAGDQFPKVMREALYLRPPTDPAFITPQTKALVSLAISNARNWPRPLKDLVIVVGNDKKRGLSWSLFSLGFHNLTTGPCSDKARRSRA